MSVSANSNRLTDFVSQFARRRVLIVGDIIADQFVYGAIARVSREAPVFILRHEQTATLAGGAANAAVNVAALGGQAVLLGVIGRDAAGDKLRANLTTSGVDSDFLIASDEWQTTTKTRILAGQPHSPRQQVIRIDYENEAHLSATLDTEILEKIEIAARDASAIVVSDYNYGVANAAVANTVRKIGDERKIPILVDSRFRLHDFGGATTATPNETEIEELLGQKFERTADLANACANLREKLNLQALLVTRGANGMLLVEAGKNPTHLPAVGSAEAVDVTGAGDTVMAAYALALTAGASFVEAAAIANHAGGIVVMKRGTATVSAAELLNSLKSTIPLRVNTDEHR